MNSFSVRGFRQISWSTMVMFTLGFWLSASLILDAVIIPSLLAAGMMTEAGFASASYMMFGMFNHIEILCAALVLTGFLVLSYHHEIIPSNRENWSIVCSVLLLAIALLYTYVFTPNLSGLGLQLSLFDSSSGNMSTAMIHLHEGYWFLEGMKFILGAVLLRWCYRNSCSLV